MAIPTYEEVMLPLMRIGADKQEHSMRQVVDRLATDFKLTDMERKELLPSGRDEVFNNRVGWARTYLKKAGLVEITRWGYFKITERGLALLKENPAKIDTKFLYRYKEFGDFKAYKRTAGGEEVSEPGGPVEALETASQAAKDSLAIELREQLKKTSPRLFERIVVDLLLAMGYGGNLKDAGEAVGGIGDEGIDGIIKADKLGLDTIYIQAKRWDKSPVGRPEVHKFAGALQGKHAKKGIFITTSDYTKEARDYVSSIENKIILIDGNELAQFMIDFNVGVTVENTFYLKKVNSDYFAEE